MPLNFDDPVRSNTDVLITGAGPVGLMAACQLAWRKVSFRIIDKKDAPTSYSGALFIQAGSLEILDQMGLAGQGLHAGIIINRGHVFWNGKRVLDIDIRKAGASVSRFPYMLALEQCWTERILADFLRQRGHDIERLTTLTHFEQDEHGVTSVIELPDGSLESVRSRYLIGADGANSFVRQHLKIPFVGATHPQVLAIFDGKAETELPPHTIGFSFTRNAAAGLFPLVNGRWRMDHLPPDELNQKDRISFEDIKTGFAERIGMKATLKDHEWFSVFHSHTRQAQTFQRSRCFLVGDAAHVYTPVGAQGMNSGFQDAYNLAWKLEMIVKNKARPELLESYSRERMYASAKIGAASDRIFNLVAGRSFRKIRGLLVKILFPFIGILAKNKSAGRYLFKAISQTGMKYPVYRKYARRGVTPGAGERLPYLTFREKGSEVSLQDKVDHDRFLLLVFSEQDIPERLNRLVQKYAHLLITLTVPKDAGSRNLYKRMRIRNSAFILVRPDKRIAWRSDQADVNALEAWLARFFNPNSSPVNLVFK